MVLISNINTLGVEPQIVCCSYSHISRIFLLYIIMFVMLQVLVQQCSTPGHVNITSIASHVEWTVQPVCWKYFSQLPVTAAARGHCRHSWLQTKYFQSSTFKMWIWRLQDDFVMASPAHHSCTDVCWYTGESNIPVTVCQSSDKNYTEHFGFPTNSCTR